MEQSQNPGMSPAVQQAMARRQGGTPAPQLSQTSPEAPMANPAAQPGGVSEMNKSSAPQVAPPQKWEPQNQQDFVVSALAEQLKNSHKLEMEKMKMGTTGQPSMGAMPVAQTPAGQSAPPALPMPMGGGNDNYGMGGGMSDPNFLKPVSSSTSQGYFDMGVPSMSMSTNQKQNQF